MKRAWMGVWVLLAALAAITTGCGDKLREYLPLHVGNMWEYEVNEAGGGRRRVVELVIERQHDEYTFNTGEKLLYLPDDEILNGDGVAILQNRFTLGYQWIDNEMTFEITAKNARVTVPAGTFEDTVEVTWTTKYPGDKELVTGLRPTLNPGPNPRVFVYTTTYARRVGKIKEEYVTVQPDGTRTVEFVSELVKFDLVRKKH